VGVKSFVRPGPDASSLHHFFKRYKHTCAKPALSHRLSVSALFSPPPHTQTTPHVSLRFLFDLKTSSTTRSAGRYTTRCDRGVSYCGANVGIGGSAPPSSYASTTSTVPRSAVFGRPAGGSSSRCECGWEKEDECDRGGDGTRTLFELELELELLELA
jgi:hypothetical protein